MTKKRFAMVTCLGMLFAGGCSGPLEEVVSSPNGDVSISFSLVDGTPHYSVSYLGKRVIDPSPLGLTFEDQAPLSGDFRVLSSERTDIDNRWSPAWGTSSEIRSNFRQLSVALQEETGKERRLELVFRAYDDGAAFRYRLPGQEALKGFALSEEDTHFRLSQDYLCFALKRRDFRDNYEGTYDPVPFGEIQEGELIAVPLLLQGDDFSAALLEAALTDYSGMSLRRGEQPLELVLSLAPLPKEEQIKVRGKTPFRTPWRVVLLARQAGKMIESNLIWNLNEPAAFSDTSWIKPGKVVWPWWNNRIATDSKIKGGQPSTAVMQYYIDFAARHGIPNLLVDAGWYSLEMDAWNQPEKEDVLTMEETRASFYDIRKVIQYGKRKGVAVHLWVHFASLRGRVEEVLSTYAEWGAAGIKLDNFGGEDQELVNDFHDVLKVAAQHKLMVDFHGAYKPTGFCRTYPNFMTSEAVLGLEYSKGRPLPTPQHTVTIPFTRMLCGPMDYTPGAFDLDGAEGFPKHVQGTRAQQIAMYVVYFSPLQMLVDYPAAYEASPDQFDFVTEVPTSWDETRFIDGLPGDFVAVARRKGADWYVGAMTDENPREIEVSLSFLDPLLSYGAEILADGANVADDPQQVDIQRVEVSSTGSMTLHLAAGGGAAMRISPLRTDSPSGS